MTRIVSGIQATNRLHIGNYLGALRNWVDLQHGNECLMFIADLHAITVPQDPVALHRNVRELAATYVAAGIDPDKVAIFAQSTVPAHNELAWILGCLTPLGWLNRMTQFKDKAGKDREEAGLGLYSYPVLMAADVLLYHGQQVPVGDDQKQHVELMRDIAQAFNRRYEREYFKTPEPLIMGEATRVMSLRDGTKKMSKSAESDFSRINLTDDADAIAQKIRKAKSDTEPLPGTLDELKGRPEASNLVTLYAALGRTSRAAVIDEFAGRSFSDFKPRLADLTVATIAPISARMKELMADEAALDAILHKGTARARAIADVTIAEVKAMVGF
jgi:tryptophanyl-tRNA synthetase